MTTLINLALIGLASVLILSDKPVPATAVLQMATLAQLIRLTDLSERQKRAIDDDKD